MSKKDFMDDLEIIDLDAQESTESAEQKIPIDSESDLPSEETVAEENETPGKKIPSRVIFHIATLVVVVFVILFIANRFSNFGVHIDQSDIFKDGQGEYSDTMDLMLPVDKEFLEGREDDGVTTIVAFGNAPFSDDRYSEDNLANLIAQKADAVVYNCSFNNSYLAAQEPHLVEQYAPLDAFTFYWLACLACDLTPRYLYDNPLTDWTGIMPEARDETLDTICNLDFNTVDVIAIMYDATDYFMGNYIYDISNHNNVMSFTGNLSAGIDLFQQKYPHIRIIVMSPTYAYYVDEEGNYLSSDQYKYNPDEDILATYCIYQGDICSERAVTFVDNIYGTITEDNASEYLEDHLHLNQKGRELVADRFVEALTYFDE